MRPRKTRRCAVRLASVARVDPFTIHPFDVTAILSFVDRVAPLPATGRRNALQTSLNTLWTVYRPDLDGQAVAERLAPFASSGFALARLGKAKSTNRVERGRLQLIWFHFLSDISGPGDAQPELSSVLRARAMTIDRRPGPVRAFLREVVDGASEDYANALRTLWERCSETPAPQNWRKPTVLDAFGLDVLWAQFLDEIDPEGASHPQAPRIKGRRASIHLPTITSIADVGADPKRIAAYLLSQAPRVGIREADAAQSCFDVMYRAHGVPERRFDLLGHDLFQVVYERHDPAFDRLSKAWALALKDLFNNRQGAP